MTINELKLDVQSNIKSAMIAKNTIMLETYRSISVSIVNFEKNNPGKEILVIDLIGTMAKQRQQSIDAFIKGGNTELANKEKIELDILNQYLPQKMSDDELSIKLTDLINNFNPRPTLKEMGMIISEFKKVYPGQDMGKISTMIKNIL